MRQTLAAAIALTVLSRCSDEKITPDTATDTADSEETENAGPSDLEITISTTATVKTTTTLPPTTTTTVAISAHAYDYDSGTEESQQAAESLYHRDSHSRTGFSSSGFS